jgi:cold shock CspA family protein
MEMPEVVVSSVRAGRVVLFLSSGMSLGARTPNGKRMISEETLRDALSEKFLSGQYRQESLQWVAELAISVSDLGTVQDFIAFNFQGIQPADFHLILPTFRWKGIVTANFDRLVETAYEKSKNRVQELVPIISNNDRIDEKTQSANSLALLKLHGCITRTQDPKLPLILSTNQYSTHRESRDRLFKTFYEWCYDSTVIFIGGGAQDSELRLILFQILKEVKNRPLYYLIQPKISDAEKNLWETKRIVVLEGQFEDFIRSLDKSIDKKLRPLAQALQLPNHPIERKFTKQEPIVGSLKDLLIHDVEYVHDSIEVTPGSAEQFYKGFDLGWYPIIQDLDVKRRLIDTVIGDVVLRPDSDRPTLSELYLIKAEAGAGKTIFLRRVAWIAATQADATCLFMKPLSTINFEALQELYRLINERIFIFIDAAADNVSLIIKLIEDARRFNVPLTVITAERTNEWNMSCESLADYVNNVYQLHYLSEVEIRELVELLTKNDVLGPNLQGKTLEEKIKEFEERAGRQLLVALHEATMGQPFEDIIVDEYNNIYPKQAQTLYLTVCLLNRLGIMVRAGLIARVHEIAFDEFKQRLFSPLEHVVQVKGNVSRGDFFYAARHPQIAQIVFEEILVNDADRYNEYARVINCLNISYDTDRESFRKLINAKALQDLFTSHEDIKAIFDVAKEIAEDAYLYQQMANYERLRPDGDYQLAEELLNAARELDPRDSSIIHTQAELAAMRARKTERPLERRKFRNQARSLLESLINNSTADRYARNSYLKLAIDDLRDIFADENHTAHEVEDASRNIERMLESTKQKYPEDYFVNNLEAEFADLFKKSEKALKALEKAFKANPRDPYITMRLANSYKARNDLKSAKNCVYQALNSHMSSKELNYEYAQILRMTDPFDIEGLSYYFRKSFSKWDQNYYAQFWYARYLFENNDLEKVHESKQIFSRLRSNAPIKHELRIKIIDFIRDRSGVKSFLGTVSRIELEHGFITVDGRGDDMFFHKNNITKDVWSCLKTRSRVSFNVGFTFSGPVATGVKIA